MSTSLLYHGWGLRGYRYLRSEFSGGRIEFVIEQNPDTRCCSDCGGRRVVRQGQVTRRFKTLPIGSKRVTIVLRIQRLGVCRLRQDPTGQYPLR